jgi:uncharacterized RDD family membrane protein YckC
MPPVSETFPFRSDADARWDAAAPDLPPFPRPRPPVPVTPTVRYAGLLVRAVALTVDVAVLALFTGPLMLAGVTGVRAGFLVLGVPPPVVVDDTLMTLLSYAWGTMAVVYFTALHRGHGQTIGKAAVGIRVRTARDFAAIGFVRSLLRTLAYAMSSTLFGLGFLVAAFNARKRAWHDYVAGTCVVHMTSGEA